MTLAAYHPCWWDVCGRDAGISVSAGPQSLVSVAGVSNGWSPRREGEGTWHGFFRRAASLESLSEVGCSTAWSHGARRAWVSTAARGLSWSREDTPASPSLVTGHQVHGAGGLTGWFGGSPPRCWWRTSCPTRGAAAGTALGCPAWRCAAPCSGASGAAGELSLPVH